MAATCMKETDVDALTAKYVGPLQRTPLGHELRKLFCFDDGWSNLNHGSFGAAPKAITDLYRHYSQAAERRPDQFIRYVYPSLLAKSRTAIASLLKVPVGEVVFVSNATTGVNTVLRNLRFSPGEKIVYFSFIYGACGHTISYIAETTPAEAIRIDITLPVSDDEIIARFNAAIEGQNVKVAVFDTITSMPARRLPFEALVKRCKEVGILSLVDAAHCVGQIPIDLGALDADFFVSNLHKWLYVPRGCAVFHVPARNQKLIRSSLPTSWGFVPEASVATSPMPRVGGEWANMFNFTGTLDTAAFLCVYSTIEWRKKVCGGEEEIMKYADELARVGERVFMEVLETNESFGGDCAMINIKLPLEREGLGEHADKVVGWLEEKMIMEHEMYIAVFGHNGGYWVRVSGQVYLEEQDFAKGAHALKELIGRVKDGSWLLNMEALELRN